MIPVVHPDRWEEVLAFGSSVKHQIAAFPGLTSWHLVANRATGQGTSFAVFEGRPGDDDVVFLRCNQRHHSLALVPASEPALYHLMVEARTLDDVGHTLDRHIDAGAPISMTLGKHTNDHMVSFYSRSPSGFDVEFGCNGLLVDDATWTVTQITKPSFWGHRSPTP